jgi:hypothetical protein
MSQFRQQDNNSLTEEITQAANSQGFMACRLIPPRQQWNFRERFGTLFREKCRRSELFLTAQVGTSSFNDSRYLMGL